MTGIPTFAPWITAGVVALSVVIFAIMILREHTRITRQDTNQCLLCGYDLRASADRCPECGTAFDRLGLKPGEQLDPEKLSQDWPNTTIAPIKPELNEQLAVAFHTNYSFQANLAAEQLEARGVWAQVHDRTTTQMNGYIASSLVVQVVVIRATDQDAAKQILNRFRRQPVEG